MQMIHFFIRITIKIISEYKKMLFTQNKLHMMKDHIMQLGTHDVLN